VHPSERPSPADLAVDAAPALTTEQKERLQQLHGRHFLRLYDFAPAEIADLLALARILKQRRRLPILGGQALAMLFVKHSTRTRVSFEVGINRLGGYAVVLNASDIHLSRGEPLCDTARVLSRYVDGIMIRTFAHSDVEELARFSSVPVINGLTDDYHPCQAMADLLTILEQKGRLAGLRFVYVGDGFNMAHSLLAAGAKTGMHVTICCPAGYEPRPDILAMARSCALPGTKLEVEHDPIAASRGADVLYTDVWTSMGQEEEQRRRVEAFQGFQINGRLLERAASDCLVMHCLPAHRGEEITAEALESPQSVVFDQAENRLHAQNAVMAALMGHPERYL
jgi:ornithine carbamoyltransferase